MRVSVLGANGFVGTRIVERWLGALGTGSARQATSYIPVPIVRSFPSLARLSRFDLECRIADGRDEEAMRKAFAGSEVVVHCVAGNADVVAGTSAPAYRAADAVGVRRMVYLSSASVHGQNPASGTDESTPLSAKQWSWYNNAKVHAERRLLAARGKGKTEVVILRPGIVWGPRSRWVTDFVEATMKGEAYVVNGGTAILNSIFVDNLIQSVELAMDVSGADREAFIVQDQPDFGGSSLEVGTEQSQSKAHGPTVKAVCWRNLFAPLCLAVGGRWEGVGTLPPPEVARPTTMDRIEGVRLSKAAQKTLPLVPSKLKRTGKAILRAWPSPVEVSTFALPIRRPPSVTEEMSRLQTCGWRLPDVKAREHLGYEPGTTFRDGLEITLDWLCAAGYPIASRKGAGSS